MEKIRRCAWPVKCILEAKVNVVDFGYNPPVVREYCLRHASIYKDARGTNVILEGMKP